MNEFLFKFLNNFVGQNIFFDNIVWFCAEILIFLTPFLLVYFILTSIHKKLIIQNSLLIGLTGVFAWGVSSLIKYFFSAPRPFLVLDSVNLLFQHGEFDSFPSGHTTFLVAFAVIFWFYNRRIGIFLIIISLIVGLARVIGGVHWPLDILGGFVLGGSFALLMQGLYLRLTQRLK